MEEYNIIDVTENIKNEIKSNDVVLFMKGTPVFPMCGFSAATVQVLSDMGVKFSSVNVLDSNEMREGIKKFSNWPTIPQLYVKEELEKFIKESIPDSTITIEDLKGDGDHYSATVISKSFEGKSKIEQHKMVYDSLKGKMGNELHALMLKTRME